MFVASRAVPTFSGLPRPEQQAKAPALGLAAVVIAYVGAALWSAPGTRNARKHRMSLGHNITHRDLSNSGLVRVPPDQGRLNPHEQPCSG